MSILNSVFWFLGSQETVKVVKKKFNIKKIEITNAKVTGISEYSNNTEIRFREGITEYSLDGGQLLKKVNRAYKKKEPSSEILFSAILEVENCRTSSGTVTGKIIRVLK